jgi:hypothetical protein
MTKKFKIKFSIKILFIMISLSSPSFSLSPEYKNELRNGCYMNSKQYLGDKKAKVYCLCTVEMLSKKYNNHQIDKLFKKKPEEVIKNTEFAARHCEKNKKAF